MKQLAVCEQVELLKLQTVMEGSSYRILYKFVFTAGMLWTKKNFFFKYVKISWRVTNNGRTMVDYRSRFMELFGVDVLTTALKE